VTHVANLSGVKQAKKTAGFLCIRPSNGWCIRVHLDQSAGLAGNVAKPSRADITLVHHIHLLACDNGMPSDAIVILNHVHGNIQSQHAWRTQNKRSHPDLAAHLRQAW
jgi:hypothetical protein